MSAALRTFRLRSTTGLEATIGAYGATLMRLVVPDRDGRPGDVVLGFDDPRAYQGAHPHLGCLVGRYANRIANARFALEGRSHALVANDGPHCLHGGPRGFGRATWDAEPIGDAAVELRHRSPDGDAGFPGNLDVRARYAVEGAALRIDLSAATDAPTVVSLASHAYWNLEDGGGSPILDHALEIAAARYTPVGPDGIPTGAIAPVAGTPFDFRAPERIGTRIDALVAARGGYDHNFALDGGAPFAARLVAPRSGRALTLHTTLPGLQLYTGNGFDGRRVFRGGAPTPRFGAVALEAQQFPNAPNEPSFPSARLDPGQPWQHRIVYALSAI
jgi:aldose 1-epimerase